jgi:hypothetical protein
MAVTVIKREPVREANISEYPESMRGGSWDRTRYAGSPDAAHALALVGLGIVSADRPNWHANVQRYYDGWRHAWRVLRMVGRCIVCDRRSFAFDDGENDPRGILGDRAAQIITHEDVPELHDDEYVAACFSCMNDEARYHRALDLARFAVQRSTIVTRTAPQAVHRGALPEWLHVAGALLIALSIVGLLVAATLVSHGAMPPSGPHRLTAVRFAATL